jgi:hypothetical protein
VLNSSFNGAIRTVIPANHKPLPLSDAAKYALRSIIEESEDRMEEMKKKKTQPFNTRR